MESSDETKQITIDVPAERLAEFYAFFSRFLAGEPGRGRRRHDHHGHHGHGPGHRGHHCGPRRAEAEGRETQTTGGAPAGTTSV
jgi:hypothetical protein